MKKDLKIFIDKAAKCMHCGEPVSKKEGLVCNKCYSKYSQDMLQGLEE